MAYCVGLHVPVPFLHPQLCFFFFLYFIFFCMSHVHFSVCTSVCSMFSVWCIAVSMFSVWCIAVSVSPMCVHFRWWWFRELTFLRFAMMAMAILLSCRWEASPWNCMTWTYDVCRPRSVPMCWWCTLHDVETSSIVIMKPTLLMVC